LAGARGARTARLDVSAPFHCALMRPAADGVAAFLGDVEVREPRVPVVTSVDARPVAGGADIVPLLVRQVTAPVRWEETMTALRRFEPTVALEVGPGRVLSGLARRQWPDVPCHPVGDSATLAAATEKLA